MLRGGGTTIHLGLLRGANDFPKPSLGRVLRGQGNDPKLLGERLFTLVCCEAPMTSLNHRWDVC